MSSNPAPTRHDPRPLRDSLPATLCHPDGVKSCGACCGMYNHRQGISWQDVMQRLASRTLIYRQHADIAEQNSLRAFRLQHEPSPHEKLLDGLPSCPFLGLLDLHSPQDLLADPNLWLTSRVGCLVHPLQNDGQDGRDCGVYDRTICQSYLCASHDVMRREEQWLVIQAVPDSYLYGLVITDTRFVRELFELAARYNGAFPTWRHIDREIAIQAARDYFELKRDWPWRDLRDGLFGQVVPGVGLDTTRRQGPAESIGEPVDELEGLLRCLGTRVSSLDELTLARDAARQRILAFAHATT